MNGREGAFLSLGPNTHKKQLVQQVHNAVTAHAGERDLFLSIVTLCNSFCKSVCTISTAGAVDRSRKNFVLR